MPIQKIRPFLWFGENAHEAAKLYVKIFDNSRIIKVMGSPDGSTPMGVELELDGTQIIAFNGGPHYKLTAAVSLMVQCDTQAEVDRYWDALIADGGSPSQCGWLTDKFGLSWQIIPEALPRLMSDKDATRAGRVVQAMLKMSKIDIATLERAHEGAS